MPRFHSAGSVHRRYLWGVLRRTEKPPRHLQGARVEQWCGTDAVIRQGRHRLTVELLEGEGRAEWIG